MPKQPTKRLAALFAVTALALVAGCESDDGHKTPTSAVEAGASDSEAQNRILTRLNRALDLLENEDLGKYCKMLTDEAVSAIETLEVAGDSSCEGVMRYGLSILSEKDIAQMRKPDSIELNGNKALVKFPVDSGLSPMQFENVDGKWMIAPNPKKSEDSVG